MDKLTKTVRKTIATASKLLEIKLPSMESIYTDRTMKKANNIVAIWMTILPPLFTKNRSEF